jgi:hypothetical protein
MTYRLGVSMSVNKPDGRALGSVTPECSDDSECREQAVAKLRSAVEWFYEPASLTKLLAARTAADCCQSKDQRTSSENSNGSRLGRTADSSCGFKSCSPFDVR